MNVNKVILVGRLTKDPEVRTTNSGRSVTSFGIATNRYWTDKNGQKQESTQFHNVVLWGKLAEIAGQYLTKGQEAYIEGRLETRVYQTKDNTNRYVTEVIGDNMQLGSKPRGTSSSQPYQPAAAPVSSAAGTKKEEEIPTINLEDEEDEVKIEDVPF